MNEYSFWKIFELKIYLYNFLCLIFDLLCSILGFSVCWNLSYSPIRMQEYILVTNQRLWNVNLYSCLQISLGSTQELVHNREEGCFLPIILFPPRRIVEIVKCFLFEGEIMIKVLGDVSRKGPFIHFITQFQLSKSAHGLAKRIK